MNNILLIGMPGSGKSTAGVILAKTLGMDFVDTDLMLSRSQGMLLQKIIDQKGLEYFAAAESAVGCSLKVNDTVIATGGSMVESDKAMTSLKRQAVTVFLDVEPDELNRRITNITTRGIAFGSGKTLFDVYDSRIALYRSFADITVDSTRLTTEQTVARITETLGKL